MIAETTNGNSAIKIKLSTCMIVRDSARTLPACLESIRPWTDELVVVDTGSQDDTPEIARRYGARLFSFPWCDDFSAARNESLRHAQGEWLFWMDSDDTIDEQNGRKLRELASAEHPPSLLGFVMQVHCPGPSAHGEDDFTFVDHVKLLRNLPGLRFDGRIHEQVLPAIRRLGGDVGWTDVHVVHAGSDQSSAGRRRKHERDLRILQFELAERPDHPFTLFNLGMTYADTGDYVRAVDFLNRSITVAAETESQLRKAYALLVNAYCQLQRFDAAKDACRRGRRLFPDDPELQFREGILAHHERRYADAERAYRDVLGRRRERCFSSLDSGIFSFKSRHNLALVYEDTGRTNLVELQWRHVVEEKPNYRLGWRGLVDSLVKQRRFETARVEIQHMMMNSDSLRSAALLMQARLAEAQSDIGAAMQHLFAAVREFPENVELLEALCRFLFERGEPLEAKHALEKLIVQMPNDGAAWHNLGTVNTMLGLNEAAIVNFRRSLEVRPDSPTTRSQMAQLLESLGRTNETEKFLTKTLTKY